MSAEAAIKHIPELQPTLSEEDKPSEVKLPLGNVKSQIYHLFGEQKVPDATLKSGMSAIADKGYFGVEEKIRARNRDDAWSEREKYQRDHGYDSKKWTEGFDFFLTRVRADKERKDFLEKIGVGKDTDAIAFYTKYLSKKDGFDQFINDIETSPASSREIEEHGEIIKILGKTFGQDNAQKRIEQLIYGIRNIRENPEEFIKAVESSPSEQKAKISTLNELATKSGIKFGAKGNKGGINRKSIEDAAAWSLETDLFGVFDGQDSKNEGYIASNMASRALRNFKPLAEDNLAPDELKERLKIALKNANRKIIDEQKEERLKGIRTSASVIKIAGQGDERDAYIASMGDSRIYIQTANGEFKQITADSGDVLGENTDIDPTIQIRKIGKGDKILLVSNETVQGLSEGTIRRILADQDLNMFEMAEKIARASGVTAANDRTAIVIGF